MKKFLAAIAVFPLLLMSAAAQDAPGNAAAGKTLWQGPNTECRSCHGDNGEGGFGPTLAGQGLTPDQIQSELRHPVGTMPAFTEAQITPADINNLAAYFAGQPKPAAQGAWRFTPTASMPKGQQTFHNVGCAMCHLPVFYRARANMGGSAADFDLFKGLVYAHSTGGYAHMEEVLRDPAAPAPTPDEVTRRNARLRMGNFNPATVTEAQVREIFDWMKNGIGFRPLITPRMSAPAVTPQGATYTLNVANNGAAGKGLAADGITVDLAVPAGSTVVSITGDGYKGLHKAAAFNLVDVYGNTRATKNNVDVAEWQIPHLAPRDKVDLTITLSKPAAAGDALEGTLHWAKPTSRQAANEVQDVPAARAGRGGGGDGGGAAAAGASPATGPGGVILTFLPNPSNDEIRSPRPPRQRGIPVALALEAAQAANAACLVNGTKSTTVVLDSEGVPIAMVSNDGAAAITQRIAMGKAMIALKIKDASGNAAKADPALMANLGTPRAGGLPLMAGSDVVGAIAVSGSPTPPPDEACAKVGIAKIQDRIK